MSSSDAGKLGGRRQANKAEGKHNCTSPHRSARTTRTTSDQREETACEGILQEQHLGDKTESSACHTETINKELSPGAVNVVHVTSFYCRLSAPPSTTPASAGGLPATRDTPPPPCPPSLPKALRDELHGKSLQDHGSASPGASFEESVGLTPSEKTSVLINNEEEAVPDYVSSTTSHTVFCEFPEYDYDDGSLQTVPPVSKLNSTSVDSAEDRKSNWTELETPNHLGEFTKPKKAMLSSAMVSVLAPHWSRRNQRTKKGISAEDFEVQNVAHGPNTGAQSVHNRFLEPHRQFRGERVLRDGPHVEERGPLVGPRRRTDGWSSLSGPSSLNLNFSTKRLMPRTVSFDMDSCSLDNRDTVGCHTNPKEKTPPPIPSLSLDLRSNERNSPGGHHGPLAQPSSKPTTSSFLLSLRKIGSNWRSQSMSETGSRSLTSSNRDRAAIPFNLNPPFTPPSNNSAERWMTRPYSSHIPYGPDKSNPNISQTNSVTKPTFSHLQKPISTDQPGRQKKGSIADNNTDPARLSQYEQYTILMGQDLPRGTTLRSGTWWRQVTQEGSSQPGFKDTASIINNNRNETNTPLVTPCNRNSDLASLSPNDNRSLNRQIPNRAEHNKAEAIGLGTHALVFKRQQGPDTLRRSNAEDKSDQQPDMFSTHSKGFNLNEKQSQQPRSSLSEVNKVNANKASANIINQNVYSLDKSHLTANTQTALLTPSPVSSPTNMDCTFSENTSPKILNENQSIHTFKKPSHPLDANDTLTCHAQKPASSQDASFQSTTLPRCIYKRPKPLVFERTYPIITKHVHPKALFIYQSTVSSKANLKPTSPTNPSSVHLTAPVTVPTATSPTPLISTSFLLTPPVTPTPACSPSPKSSLSKKERTFSESLDISSSKKKSPKGQRRVTWQDSVDLQKSEDDIDQASLPATPSPPRKTSPLPLTRSPRSLESPSTFSFLRKASPTEVPKSSPVCLPIPKTTKAQSGERSKLSASADPVSPMEWTSEHIGRLCTSPGPDKRLSDRASQCHSYTPLSLPPDLSYQQHYSSPPYSTLKATRSPQGDAKNSLPTSPPGFQPPTFSPSSISRPSSLSPDPATNRTSPQSQHSSDPIPPTQIVPLPFPNRSVLPEGLKCEGFRLKEAENKSRKQSNKNTSASQEDRAVIGSECLSLQATLQDKTLPPPSACLNVIETLVYSLSKGNLTDLPDKTTTRSLIQCRSNTRFSLGIKPSIQLSTKNSGVGGNQYSPLNQNANTSSTKEAQLPLFTVTDDSSANHKGPFWKNESTSRPGASLPANQGTHFLPDKATLERASKGISQMDQVVNKLRRQFSGVVSDDLTCSPKCNQSSKTPSISGSSVGNNSDITVKSNDTLQGDKEAKRMDILGDTTVELERRETEKEDRWKTNRYSLVPPQVLCNRSGDHFSSCSDITPKGNAQNKFLLSNHPFTEREAQEERTSPRIISLPFNKSDRVEVKTSETLCRDPDPRKQSPGDPPSTTLCSSSNNRPRSSFSLFSTSPISPFLTPTEVDDSVFYSPKELTSPVEMGRSVSLLDTARRKMSTSPSTVGPIQEKERLTSYSSCADLKYGIDAGRSISVSSVVSSRRLGSERISKGLRVLSVDDLSDPAPETSKYKCQSMGDQESPSSYRLSSRPSEMRSRSLPRSLTRSLSCWASEDSPPKRQSPTTSPQDRLLGPRSRNTDLFQYYSEGPLTPPPSPASPAGLLMSKPPSRSSSQSPGASRDSLSVRGLLPTRGMVASLSDFDESSDSSSDSTTDDEYYLDSEEDDEKESAL